MTKHLKGLQRAGLIVQGRDKHWRPCRLQPQPLKEAAELGVTRHPMAPTWPLSKQSTTTVTDEGRGTRMTLQWQAIDCNDELNATFDGAHASMTQGWGGTMDQLAGYIARIQQRA